MTLELLANPKSASVAPAEDDMHQYLKEIRQYPRLSVLQERELAMECAAGNEEAIRKMVNSNLRLVVSVAREYAGRGVSLMDLIQEGSIGLLTAAKKFDYTLEYRFSTYATKWIRQRIGRYLLNQGMIRVPAHTAERMRKVLAARTRMLQAEGVEPEPAKLAQECNIPEDKVQQLLQLIPEVCSLDTPVGEEENTLGLLLEDTASLQPYEELVRHELAVTMDALLGSLSQRQQEVLRLHFGMTDGQCLSMEQIGRKLGISKERVRQIEQQAMEKLRKRGTDIGLEDFLE